MPTVTLTNLGSAGIIRDLPDHLLPPEVWSFGQNVRFRDNKAVKFTGHKKVWHPPSVSPYWGLSIPTATTHFWLYASLKKAYALTGGVHTDITRLSGDYNATETGLWNGGVLGGVPVINNGIDVPQMWIPVGAGQRLQNLSNWPGTLRAKTVRPYKSFLIALNISKSGTAFPHMVKWSHPADPGSVPISWDETDPTKDAGETDLSDAQAGIIQDGLELRDAFIIYKDSSTWGMQFTGGIAVMRFYPIFKQSGILSNHCMCFTPDGAGHFVKTQDDLIVHDGQNVQSVSDKRWRRFIQKDMDGSQTSKAFCFVNRKARECWFCYPEVGAPWASKALVWNVTDNALGIRDLSNISFIAPGIVDEVEADDTWDADPDIWEVDTTIWDDRVFNTFSNEGLSFNPVAVELSKIDTSEQFSGTNFKSVAQRTGLAIAGKNRQGEPVIDIQSRKFLKRIWPRVKGGPIDIRVGGQEEIGGVISWMPSQTFNPATQQYLDVCVNARLLAIEFSSMANISWEVEGYDLEVEVISQL